MLFPKWFEGRVMVGPLSLLLLVVIGLTIGSSSAFAETKEEAKKERPFFEVLVVETKKDKEAAKVEAEAAKKQAEAAKKEAEAQKEKTEPTNVMATGEATSGKEACDKEACDKEGCDATACEEGACETEACDSETNDSAIADATAKIKEPAAGTSASDTGNEVPASHQQTAIIKVHVDELPKHALQTFCLTSTGDILAACSNGELGDLRHFTPTGEFLNSWELPFAPEAINFGDDGKIYAAGQGKFASFTLEGEVIDEGVHPFGEVTEERLEELRKEVVASHNRQREWMTDYIDDLDSQIETIEKRLGIEKESEASEDESLQSNAAEKPKVTLTANSNVSLDSNDGFLTVTADEITVQTTDAGQADSGQAVAEHAIVEDEVAEAKKEESAADIARRQRDETMLTSLTSQRKLYQEMVDRQGEEELTEEQIEKRVQSSVAYKMKVASISESNGEVFIATGASSGYGFSVWRMNPRFEEGTQIVDKLSGCCGQMDVQACEAGIYVAENSRHKVRCFDRTGEEVCSWGSGAREGLSGFGGCCNPMNVAFGPEKSVYTAESETGRIKRYSSKGELLGLVGKAKLVPGCKKVSIAVGPKGDRVYMLDITRNHIVMLERLSEEEQVAYYEKDLSKDFPEPEGAFATFFRTMGKAMVGNN